MRLKKQLKKHVRGWFPREVSLPDHQRIKTVDHTMRLQLFRLVYGIMLGALLVTPFGVYHSTSEPYVTGSLWGYYLPVGYVGLLLGILVILYPRFNILRSVKFGLLMVPIGLSLLTTLILSPNAYFINLFHGTNFSPNQIDVDFILGNSATLALSLLSIGVGLFSFIIKKKAAIGS